MRRLLLTLALLMMATAAHAADLPLTMSPTTGQPRQIPSATALQLRAATTGSASENMPQGVAPSSPADGDHWQTSAGFFYRAGGVTYGPITLSSVTCGAPLTGGTITTTGTCGIATNGLALSYLAQIGGSSYLGNQSTSTGNVTAYAWPTCTNDGSHALVSLPSASPPVQCPAITAAAGGTNPFFIGVPDIKTGTGAPSASSDPVGSIYLRTDTAEIYQQYVASGEVPALVQAKAWATGGNSVTMSATPASGDLLIAFCTSYTNTPTAGTGWTDSGAHHDATIFDPADRVTTKLASAGESTTQTPCSGANAGTIYEVSGVPNFVGSVETDTYSQSVPFTYTTANSNDLVLFGAYFEFHDADPGLITITGLSGGLSQASFCCTAGGLSMATSSAGQSFATSSSSVSVSYSPNSGRTGARMLVLKPASAGWRRIGNIISLMSGGTQITDHPISINFSTGLSASDDGLGNTTVVATGPTGSGIAGAITKWASSTGLTSGDLSGDVTTSGTTATTIAAGAVTESKIGLSNVTTNDVSITKHGFVPVAPNDSTKCLIGTAVWAVCPGGGGGGGTTNNYYAGALTLIQTQALAANAGNVTFSSIPSGYTDLVVVATGRGDTAATTTQLKLQFNGDTAADYDWQYIAGSNSTASASANVGVTGITIGDLPAASATSNVASTFEAQIGSYAGTTFQKAVVVSGGSKWGTTAGTQEILPIMGFWRSTSAITSMTLTPAAGNLLAGSTFALYGRGGSNVTVNPQPGLPVIQEVVTSGSATSVTISSLPQTYRDLMVVVTGRGTNASANVDLGVQFNGDTAANYDSNRFYGTNNTANDTVALAGTSIIAGGMSAATAPSGSGSTTRFTVNNYAGTTFQKTILGQYEQKTANTSAGLFQINTAGWWRSTAAITSLTIAPTGGAFQDGTVITVYGIGGSPTATLPVVPPQGRLSLTSGQAVPTTDVTAATTIYWVPLPGGMLPVGNVMYRPGQMSFALNTTAHAAGSLYDIGAFNNGGSIALCTAPAWTSGTARSAGISQDATNGVWENTASLTCNLSGGTTTTTIAAGQWTYLGTFHASAAGQVTWSCHPAAAAGGSNNELGLFNAYNQKPARCTEVDSNATWNVTSTTWQTADNGASSGVGNRLTWVDGLQQSSVDVSLEMWLNAPGSQDGQFGITLDSTTADPFVAGMGGYNGTARGMYMTRGNVAPQLGLHFIQAMQSVSGGTVVMGGHFPTPTRSGYNLIADLEMGLWIEPANDNRLPWPAGLVLLPAIRRRERRAANDNRRSGTLTDAAA